MTEMNVTGRVGRGAAVPGRGVAKSRGSDRARGAGRREKVGSARRLPHDINQPSTYSRSRFDVESPRRSRKTKSYPPLGRCGYYQMI